MSRPRALIILSYRTDPANILAHLSREKRKPVEITNYPGKQHFKKCPGKRATQQVYGEKYDRPAFEGARDRVTWTRPWIVEELNVKIEMTVY